METSGMKELGNFGFTWRSIASVAACAVVLAGCASEVTTAPALHLDASQHVAAHQYDKEWFNAAREGRFSMRCSRQATQLKASIRVATRRSFLLPTTIIPIRSTS